MSFDTNWENKIYSQKKHINRYPYGELISVFFNSLKFLNTKIQDKKDISILELGCGAGNNLWFLSELGMSVFGIDASKSACQIANRLCDERNVQVNIINAHFDSLPFEDNKFDIIIDRESTYCGTQENIKLWWKEANRVLKKGGLVISFKFSDDNPDLIKIKNNLLNATLIEENTYTDIREGTFSDTGIVHFTTYNEIFDIFSFLDIKYINKHSGHTVFDTCNNQYNYAEWVIVGVKK
jgi:ubiquinone/menaquinone biosynthesis C-methylase UbiE